MYDGELFGPKRAQRNHRSYVNGSWKRRGCTLFERRGKFRALSSEFMVQCLEGSLVQTIGEPVYALRSTTDTVIASWLLYLIDSFCSSAAYIRATTSAKIIIACSTGSALNPTVNTTWPSKATSPPNRGFKTRCIYAHTYPCI